MWSGCNVIWILVYTVVDLVVSTLSKHCLQAKFHTEEL